MHYICNMYRLTDLPLGRTGGRAVLAVVGNNAPEGTTVVSIGTCANSMKGGNALYTQHVQTD